MASASAADEAPQVDCEIPLSLEIGVSKNIPHNSLEHSEKNCLIKASHILLGRPWLFDRRVQHDGYENTYTLIRDGRKKNLRPMKEIPVVEQLEEKLVPAKLEEPKEVVEALEDLILDFPRLIISNGKLEETTEIIEHHKFKNHVLPQDN